MASPPTKQNTAASVVTFFPDEDLAARLDVLTTQCSALVIVDNSTNIAARKLVAEAAAEAGANSIANNANLGVAAALNQAARWAESQQLEWLLTIDQDSSLAHGVLAHIVTELP
jgi:rhamnosyltransferase